MAILKSMALKIYIMLKHEKIGFEHLEDRYYMIK